MAWIRVNTDLVINMDRYEWIEFDREEDGELIVDLMGVNNLHLSGMDAEAVRAWAEINAVDMTRILHAPCNNEDLNEIWETK